MRSPAFDTLRRRCYNPAEIQAWSGPLASTERDDLPLENGRGASGAISDLMKKAIFAGIGAVFMTEESIRGFLAEAKFPRDVRNYVVQNADRARAELFGYVSKEVKQLFQRADLPKVINEFLESHTIEIRFRKIDEGREPEGDERRPAPADDLPSPPSGPPPART